MRNSRSLCLCAVGACCLVVCCADQSAKSPPPAVPSPPVVRQDSPIPKPEASYASLDRETFNRAAVRLNLSLYWIDDLNKNGSPDPNEITSLLFYPNASPWVERGVLSPSFHQAYQSLKAWANSPPFPENLSGQERERRSLVIEDLDQGRATLVHSDFRTLPDSDKAFVQRMLAVAKLIDSLYARQNGSDVLARQVPADDLSSQSLFRRNWGPRCLAPKTEKNKACSAIPGALRPAADVYPIEMQSDPKFCEAFEKHPDSKKLLEPFSVVRKDGNKFQALAYHKAYQDTMGTIAGELRKAASLIQDTKETALKTYLQAAADSFTSNEWKGADEAWAKMNAQNSKWYLRIAPDEVYWEPCSRKAGFHMAFARINDESLRWQRKLSPIQQEMEATLASLIGAPYKLRNVTFHLPDFIDIAFNAGDDRAALGATIGQSLPNWGPVANEGRGRTVVMSNLYTDPDSRRMRRVQAESLLAADTMKAYADQSTSELLSTMLHEATHNLGPAHEYKTKGKTDSQIFGGPLASTMEELKAQSGALWFIELLTKKGIISPELAQQTYVDSIVWAFNHIARGMYTDTGKRKPYSQLAAIQVGFLLDNGALSFDPNAPAANGKDKGAFSMDFAKMPDTVQRLMKLVGSLKAQGNRNGAEELAKKFVDGSVVPQERIAERMLRFPKANFVYSVSL